MKRIVVESCVVSILIVGLFFLVISGSGARALDRALGGVGLITPATGDSTLGPDLYAEPPTPTPSAFDPPTDDPVAVGTSTDGPTPAAGTVAARMRSVDRKDIQGRILGHAAVVNGPALWSESGTAVGLPASTTKLVTTFVALDRLGPEHRFRTTVVADTTGIVLVGGGDPLLGDGTRRASYPAWTSLDALAEQTATALQAEGRSSVALGYDDTLFAGPTWHPDWPSNYRDQVTPVSALTLNQGRTGPEGQGARVTDPAATTAARFAALLKTHGITVTNVAARSAPDGTEIAGIDSAPLAQIVERILLISDNDAAEIVLRHIGLTDGGTGSFTDGVQRAAATLTDHGLLVKGTRLRDGSGLSRSNRISPSTLVGILDLAAVGDHRYRSIATGLPVGGVSGSLVERYVVPGTEAGRGEVRAKTGTLRFTHTLAGYVRTDDGSLVSFALLVNDAKGEYEARVWLERTSSVLAACGC